MQNSQQIKYFLVEYLQQQGVVTKEKDWKRRSKEKNSTGQWVRTFEHPKEGEYVVLEDQDGLHCQPVEKKLVQPGSESLFDAFPPSEEEREEYGFNYTGKILLTHVGVEELENLNFSEHYDSSDVMIYLECGYEVTSGESGEEGLSSEPSDSIAAMLEKLFEEKISAGAIFSPNSCENLHHLSLLPNESPQEAIDYVVKNLKAAGVAIECNGMQFGQEELTAMNTVDQIHEQQVDQEVPLVQRKTLRRSL